MARVSDTSRDDLGAQDTITLRVDRKLMNLDAGAPEQMREEAVNQEIGWATNFFSKRDGMMRRMWRFYHKEHYDPADTAVTAAGLFRDQTTASVGGELMEDDDEWSPTLNIPTNTIDMAKLMLAGEQPIIEVLHRQAASESRATKVQQFLYGCYAINDQRVGSGILEQFTMNTLLYGWGILKTVWDETRLPPEKRLGGGLLFATRDDVDDENDFIDTPNEDFPIVMTCPFPMTVYAIPGGRDEQFRAIFEKVSIDWQSVVQVLPSVFHKNLPLGHDVLKEGGKEGEQEFRKFEPGDMVDYVDFWREIIVHNPKDGTYSKQIWHAILVEGTFVKPPTHMVEYEFLPYTIAHAINDTDPENGENMGLSFLYKVLESVKNLELNIGRAQRAVEMWADPTVLIHSNEDVPPRFEKLSGAINYLKVDERVELLQWNGSPPDVKSLIEFDQNQVMEMAFPGPGIGVFGGKSGIDTLAQQRAALSKIMEPKTNIERALDRAHTKMISLIQRFAPNTPITVRGEQQQDDEVAQFAFNIKGSETKGLRYTSTQLRARFPMDELQNSATVGGMLQQKAYSRKAAMQRFYYVRDPEAMLREIRKDEAASHPGWIQFMQDVLTKKFTEMEERRAAARQPGLDVPGAAPAAPGAPPVGGPPPGPAAPPGRPPLPQFPPGALGRGGPGSIQSAAGQVIGDAASGGIDGPLGQTARDAVLPPATNGEGASGAAANIRRLLGQ